MTPLQFLRWLLLAVALIFQASASAADLPKPTAGQTFGGIHYPINSLGYALETNYAALTHRLVHYQVSNDALLIGPYASPANPVGLSWNTNSILTGKRGVTAISIAQFGGTQSRLCLVTKRHAVGAGHYGGLTNGLTVFFLGTNNTLHRMTTSNIWVGQWRDADREDRAILTFTQDVPDDVQPMRIAAPLTNGPTGDIYALMEKYFPPEAQNPYQPRAAFWVCQHGYCGRNGQHHPGGVIGSDGGDSGSPGFIILGDECVNIGGISMNAPTTNMLRRMDDLTRSLGLNPAKYQPSYVWLTNYPTWPN